MSFQHFSMYVILFLIYSVVGWIITTGYISIKNKTFIAMGFSKIPYSPILGFAVIVFDFILLPLKNNMGLLMLCCLVGVLLIEYFLNYFVERFSLIRWWDYSDKKININGRVSLFNTLAYGIMLFLAIRYINPLLITAFKSLPLGDLRIISLVLLGFSFLDFLSSSSNVFTVSKNIKKLDKYFIDLNQIFPKKEINYDEIEKLSTGKNKQAKELANKIITKLAEIKKEKNLIKQLIYVGSSSSIVSLDIIREYFKFTKEVVIKEEKKPFAKGLGFYKLFWIFLVGSVIGYIVETLYALLLFGNFESRQGMLYGPFSQIYGFGAVILVFVLSKLQKKGSTWVFVGSALIGGFYEAFCSLIQELLLGTISWDYNASSLGILGGRTSLIYMLFWGILGIIFIQSIYPWLSSKIEKIPHKQGKFITVILFVFLIYDMGISSIAVSRYQERANNIEPGNNFLKYIDEKYNDEVMREVYPNMRIVGGE